VCCPYRNSKKDRGVSIFFETNRIPLQETRKHNNQAKKLVKDNAKRSKKKEKGNRPLQFPTNDITCPSGENTSPSEEELFSFNINWTFYVAHE